MSARWWWWCFLISVGFLFSWLSFWAVVEPDILLQARAGAEILQNWRIQTVDTWSYTAYGTPWLNIQWLSCIVFYATSKLLPGYEAFTYLRCLLVFLTVVGAGICIRFTVRTISERSTKSKGRIDKSMTHLPWVSFIIAIPWVYSMISHRLQMRSDLITTVFYISLIGISLSNLSTIRKHVLSLFTLELWANFHTGTLPFGLLYYCGTVFFDSKETTFAKRVGWILLGLSTFILNPAGINIFQNLWGYLARQEAIFADNLDFQSLNTNLLRQWPIRLWPIYALITWLGYLWLSNRHPSKLPVVYRNRIFVFLIGGFFTAMAVYRVRTVQYHVFFFLPVLAAGLGFLPFALKDSIKPIKAAVLSTLVSFAIFLWFFILPLGYKGNYIVRHAGILDWVTPVRSVEFLKKNKPAKNLFNAYAFGGYLINELPEMPVSIDSREIPFNAFQKSLIAALSEGPRSFEEFLGQCGVKTILDNYGRSLTFVEGTGYVDKHRLFYPSERWAIVYIDSVSFVILKRVPEHQALIDKYEYHYMRPGMPYNYAVNETSMSSSEKQGWFNDSKRCLTDNPRNLYCLFVAYSFADIRGENTLALSYLDAIREINRDIPEIYKEKAKIYSRMGFKDSATEALKTFNDVSRSQ